MTHPNDSNMGKQHTFDMQEGTPPKPRPRVTDGTGEVSFIVHQLEDMQNRIARLMDTSEPEDQIGKLRLAKLRAGLGVPLEQITEAIHLLSQLLPPTTTGYVTVSRDAVDQGLADLSDVQEIKF